MENKEIKKSEVVEEKVTEITEEKLEEVAGGRMKWCGPQVTSESETVGFDRRFPNIAAAELGDSTASEAKMPGFNKW